MDVTARFARLPGDSTAPAVARERVRRICGPTVDIDRLCDLELLISEVVTNALRYGHDPVELAIDSSPELVMVRVRNHGTKRPRLANPSVGDENGRGLLLVDSLSDRWGYYGEQSATVVWFCLRVGVGAH